ncbi:MAG TPA: uracil-DNA glycosylase [Gemmatimonadaceae bacterium]|nr:uracil-DNA glycosylase [Gemmatimonadaceae bacterium]
MDAKERLRRFLEQRREMGESELVLDGMSVEEVMRILGARGGAKPPLEREVRPRSAPEPGAPVAPRADAPPPAEQGTVADPGDWRATLRAAGAAGSGARPPAQATPAAPPRADAPPAPRSGDGSDDESQATIDAAADASPRTRAEDAAIARRGEDGPNERGMEPSPAPGAATPEGAASTVSGAGGWEIPGIDVPTGIVVGAAAGELFGGPMSGLATLDDVVAAVASCTRCPLYATATRPVPGEGDPNADLMCVGEAPGQNEDETGRPFVGAAGQLLTKILAAIKLSRDVVFIANVLKHRPPGNRNPNPDEVVACSPYLVRQVELVRPKVIIAFGTFAAQTLLGTKTPIGKLRGAVHRYYGIPLVVTYHPAALLRNEAWKRPTWEDVKLARRILDRAAGA